MSALIEEALPHFACPDDRGALVTKGPGALACTTCARAFRVHGGNVVELVALAPAALPDDGPICAPYAAEYLRMFHEPFSWNPEARGWGDASAITAGHRFFRDEERAVVRALLSETLGVLADVSGGAGFFLLDLAPRARLALHLDLDVASINQVHRAARERGLDRVVFVRCDYLNLPLARGSVDAALCLDTLLRGPAHDPLLVRRISDALSSNGIAVMDVHHHRPGLGALERSSGAHTYSRAEFDALMQAEGLTADAWEPLGFLPALLAGIPWLQGVDRILRGVLPPIRWLARARKR